MKAFRTMLKTELKLSLRGLDMFIFAICLPLAVLVLLGIIYGQEPAGAGTSYSFLEQSLGALAAISLCAGGVMGLPLVISEYRQRKILKRFKVTPVSPSLILAVQVTIYTLYALVSLLSLYLVAKLAFGCQFPGSALAFGGGYLLVILSIFSLGILVGGLAPNPKIAGIIASLLYFPMLLFSGATLPYEVMPVGLQKLVDFLPLTQGIKILKAASLDLALSNIWPSVVIMAVLALICLALTVKFFKWE